MKTSVPKIQYIKQYSSMFYLYLAIHLQDIFFTIFGFHATQCSHFLTLFLNFTLSHSLTVLTFFSRLLYPTQSLTPVHMILHSLLSTKSISWPKQTRRPFIRFIHFTSRFQAKLNFEKRNPALHTENHIKSSEWQDTLTQVSYRIPPWWLVLEQKEEKSMSFSS